MEGLRPNPRGRRLHITTPHDRPRSGNCYQQLDIGTEGQRKPGGGPQILVWQPKGGNGLHCQSRPGEGITRGRGAEARHGIMRGRFPLRPPRQRLAGAVHVREHAAPCAPWQPGAPPRLMVSAPGIVQGARLRGRPAPCGAPACAYPARHNGSYGQPTFRTRTPACQGALKQPKGPGSGANPDGAPGKMRPGALPAYLSD